MKVLVTVLVAVAILAAFPKFAQPYYITLVLPAFAYGIALLGFNLLFGYTGLLSFGHALFVAVGAYCAAVHSSKLGV
jgi:branched-chain amino acid transport system permease protein